MKIKTLSLLYSAKEDRMKLVINNDDEEDRIVFWITRRFYFSLLFEIETFLEKLHISPNAPIKNKQKNTKRQENNALSYSKKDKEEQKTALLKKKSNTESTLLENINIHFIKERNNFVFMFQSNTTEVKSIIGKKQFLNFYTILKSSFPKGEWGII